VCDHAMLKCTKRVCSLPSESGTVARVAECKQTRCVYSSCRTRAFPSLCEDADADSATVVVHHHHSDSSPLLHLIHGKMHKCAYNEYKQECKCLCIDVNAKDPKIIAGVGQGVAPVRNAASPTAAAPMAWDRWMDETTMPEDAQILPAATASQYSRATADKGVSDYPR
jgi:hypothetical protein